MVRSTLTTAFCSVLALLALPLRTRPCPRLATLALRHKLTVHQQSAPLRRGDWAASAGGGRKGPGLQGLSYCERVAIAKRWRRITNSCAASARRLSCLCAGLSPWPSSTRAPHLSHLGHLDWHRRGRAGVRSQRCGVSQGTAGRHGISRARAMQVLNLLRLPRPVLSILLESSACQNPRCTERQLRRILVLPSQLHKSPTRRWEGSPEPEIAVWRPLPRLMQLAHSVLFSHT
jgi:hypothetical protein